MQYTSVFEIVSICNVSEVFHIHPAARRWEGGGDQNRGDHSVDKSHITSRSRRGGFNNALRELISRLVYAARFLALHTHGSMVLDLRSFPLHCPTLFQERL